MLTTTTFSYTASALDTLPGIASRLYDSTGYSDHAQLVEDIRLINPQVTNWLAIPEGARLKIPATAGGVSQTATY